MCVCVMVDYYETHDEGCSNHSTAYLNNYAYSSKALAGKSALNDIINRPTVSCAFMDIFAKASPQFIFWPVNMSGKEL